MILTITLPPAPKFPRTHIAAKVAADYVSHAISNLPQSAWTTLMQDGALSGQVDAEFAGLVSWEIKADADPDAPELPEFTFEDVNVTIPAATAEEAYAKLCNALSTIDGGEFFTDTYSGPGVVNADTSELWPKEEVIDRTFTGERTAPTANDRIRASHEPLTDEDGSTPVYPVVPDVDLEEICECGRPRQECATYLNPDEAHGNR